MSLIVLSTGYTASLALFAPHATPKIIQGWNGDLSQATISDSSIGRVTVSFSDGGMNITITANSTAYTLETFYGVKLPVTPAVDWNQYPFLDIWMKSNSVYVAGTVVLELDGGWNATVIQKTYNTGDWHEEIVLLQPFLLPAGHPIAKLILGFKMLKSPFQVAPPDH